MKKILIVLLLFVFVLYGCSATNPTTITNATSVAPTKELETLPTEYSTTPVQKAPSDYPLVFLDANDSTCEAIVLGYVSGGKVLETDCFLYNNKQLNDYCVDMDEPENVTSDILPAGKELAFIDNNDELFLTLSQDLYLEADLLNEFVQVFATLDGAPSEQGYYLGAPASVSLHHKSVIREECRIIADMDSNGDADTISWSFLESEDSDTAFYYIITVAVEDQTYVISSKDRIFPCSKDDLAIYPIDIEQDGFFELAVFEKSFGIFREINIYKFSEGAVQTLLCHVIDGMP